MKKIIKWLTLGILMLVTLSSSAAAVGNAPLDSLSVSVESYTYGSERSMPAVTGNVEEGEERYYLRRHTDDGFGEWKEITERPLSLGMPTSGGRYELKVTVSPTENYSGGSAVCMFWVYPTELDVNLTVKERVYFGDGCREGELFTVGDLLGREYTVEYANKGSDSFSSVAPTQVGEYTLRVTARGTENYTATVKTAHFKIEKRPLSGELRLDDVTVGFDKADKLYFKAEYVGNSPIVASELSGVTPTVRFRRAGSGGSFSSVSPKDIGEYEVLIEYPESQNLSAVSLTATLKITKASISPDLDVKGWVYGNAPVAPTLKDGSNPGSAAVTYYYRAEGGEFSETVPTDAGRYTVKAVIGESERYLGGECFAELEIERGSREGLSIVFSGWKYGEQPPSPFVKGDVDGAEVVFIYSPRNEEEYSTAIPTEAGKYTVKAVVAAKGNYKESTLWADFEIEKADIHVSVFMDGWVYGEKRGVLGISGNVGGAQCLITYYRRTSEGYVLIAYDDTSMNEPWNAGSYRAVCEVLESKNYKGCVSTCEFTVSKAEPDISVEMSDYTFYGKTSVPTVTGNYGGGKESFIYTRKGDDISDGSSDIADIVTLPGDYTVTVIVAGTDNYRSATARTNFTVEKADLPVSSMGLSVKVGGKECATVEFGTPYEVSLKNNVGYGRVTYSYRPVGSDAASEDKPLAVGRYTVTVSVEATEIYKPLTLYFELEITKISRGELTLQYGDTTYGKAHPTPIISGVTDELSDARKKYEFKAYGADDSEYTVQIPQGAGRYTVRLTLSETESYAAVTVTDDFVIEKAETVIEVHDRWAVYSGKAIRVAASVNHSESEPNVAGDGVTDAGEYEVTVFVPESQNYNSATLTFTFTVKRAQGSIIGLEDIETKWNDSPVSLPRFDVSGDGEVSVEYYKDGKKLSAAPSDEGEYTVKVVLSDGKNYLGCESEAVLRITRAVTGTVGGDGEEGGYSVYLLGASLLILLVAVVILLLLLMRKKRSDPPEGLLTCGYGLPSPVAPSDDSDNVVNGEQNGDASSREDEEKGIKKEAQNEKKGGGSERSEERTDRGMIALDMWKECEYEDKDEEVPDKHPEVVYKKGGRCAEINVDTLCRHFDDGDVVDMDALISKGLINKGCKRVKLLGRGEMTKELDIRLDSYSRGAIEMLKGSK